MLERIPDLPDHVLGIKASGEVTSDDYHQVLIPAVKAALEGQDKLRLFYVLGADVTGISVGAVWEDVKTGLGHYSRWEKTAVVTDKEWLRHSIDMFGYLIPGEFKAFSTAEEATARSWVTN